jgi:hypothetical protein
LNCGRHRLLRPFRREWPSNPESDRQYKCPASLVQKLSEASEPAHASGTTGLRPWAPAITFGAESAGAAAGKRPRQLRTFGNCRRSHGVYAVVYPLGTTLLVAAMAAAQGSLPWVFPGDFRERLRISDLVVSGTIEETVQAGSRIVGGTKVTANVARLRVDRVFEGSAPGRELRITWFTLYWEMTGKGFAYSGPPLADFRPGKRYLVFLRRARSGWEVAIRSSPRCWSRCP